MKILRIGNNIAIPMNKIEYVEIESKDKAVCISVHDRLFIVGHETLSDAENYFERIIEKIEY